MGAAPSINLDPEVIQELQEDIIHQEGTFTPVFTAQEINRLYHRFTKLDKSSSGFISTDEFLSLPELAMNPLNPRVIALFQQEKGEDKVNFKDFVQVLAVFSPKASRKDKLRLAFKMYDVDGDGFISQQDLYHVVKLMVGKFVPEETLRDIVATTIARADCNGDGRIDLEEFSLALAGADLERTMSFKSKFK
ncbi:Calcineurin subunit B type 1 [Balamuthia mandrillaris]